MATPSGTPANTNFGTDIDCGPYDIPLIFGTCTGNKNLGNALVRRLTTPRGALALINPSYGPNYGTDIRSLLSSALTRNSTSSMQAAIQAECQKDPRVQSAAVTVVLNLGDPTHGSATVTIIVTTSNGPFPLVLSVDQLTVEILSIG